MDMTDTPIASIIMAAGRGSRMKGFDGNKTLLPLVPGPSIFEGSRPVLRHILDTLPEGPKALIVHFRSDAVMAATRGLGLRYCRQHELNGTGGALLAAREFLEDLTCDRITITMGDVPFVRADTYRNLIRKLEDHPLVVLGFEPADKKKYGVLEIEGDRVARITEWKYWRDYPTDRQAALSVCNAGIYAARRELLLQYLSVLESRPQIVHKERDGQMVPIQEYFITDIVEYMTADGLRVGYALAGDETETLGIDDPEALENAQRIYRKITS
jgi:bifunctional UDP-N-acetylglucosamine pyrophosphorylase / glucosamine-1-phosphate N-acetyltransferase